MTRYSRMKFAYSLEVAFDNRKRLARFIRASLRGDPIVKVFPYCRVLPQINEDGGSTASVIHQELHSTHESFLWVITGMLRPPAVHFQVISDGVSGRDHEV